PGHKARGFGSCAQRSVFHSYGSNKGNVRTRARFSRLATSCSAIALTLTTRGAQRRYLSNFGKPEAAASRHMCSPALGRALARLNLRMLDGKTIPVEIIARPRSFIDPQNFQIDC